jgi:hypothetical protein
MENLERKPYNIGMVSWIAHLRIAEILLGRSPGHVHSQTTLWLNLHGEYPVYLIIYRFTAWQQIELNLHWI